MTDAHEIHADDLDLTRLTIIDYPSRTYRALEADPLARLRELRDLPARIPQLRREAVTELLAQGWTRSQIARELGISRQAVQEWTSR